MILCVQISGVLIGVVCVLGACLVAFSDDMCMEMTTTGGVDEIVQWNFTSCSILRLDFVTAALPDMCM